jgi:uncharacterized protein YbbK (DUF523 family)
MKDRIQVGISSCLMGNEVRYDGGHKLDPKLVDRLSQHFDLVPVCPEAEAGLGIPRGPMQLVGDPESPRLMTLETKIDHTAVLENWARKRVKELEKENLRGFIFKSRSPSCGIRDVEVLDEKTGQTQKGPGIFARIFTEHFPNLPVEDEIRLHDPNIMEEFIQRVLE